MKKSINAIYDLRSHGFIHYYNEHLTVGYKKEDWEVSEDLNEGYLVKKKGFVRLRTEDFKEVVKYLNDKKVI